MSKHFHERDDGSVRKAYASKGDDVTFSRFVKVQRPPSRIAAAKRQHVFPGMGNASIESGRSLFYRKGVKPVSGVKNVLVSGHNNVKIGRDIRKGKFRGYWIYTLSLEERATCPRSCVNWRTCYGNNMPYAKRVAHGKPLLDKLSREIPALLGVRGRVGVMVRLHALGDFYSRDYVWFWRDLLWKYPKLAVYGYTARTPDSDIGFAIATVKRLFGDRFAIRWSDGGQDEDCTVSTVEPVAPPGAFLCPEQTGKTKGCGTCALCWATKKNVAFVIH